VLDFFTSIVVANLMGTLNIKLRCYYNVLFG